MSRSCRRRGGTAGWPASRLRGATTARTAAPPPAAAAMAGFVVESIPSDRDGNLDMDALERALDRDGDGVAALMLTLPSTLGLFEPRIARIAELLHSHGALLYGDGANMNAMLGRVKPGDLGFD